MQIESSLFPLYDRNRKTFVPDIFFAEARRLSPGDDDDERGSEARSAVLCRL